MIQTSIVIPSRNERFLVKTVNDILSKHGDNIEIIVVLEGYWEHDLPNDKRVLQIHHGEPLGMRQSINDAVAIALGEYILKIDGHCMVSDHMCDQLVTNWQKDTDVVIPRRKRLDPENWCETEAHKTPVDYEFLSAPIDPNDWGGKNISGKIWDERSKERKHIPIDETPAFQGSCWFMKKEYFHWLELMDHEKWGPFWNECQEISFKSFLSGGRCLVNKNAEYFHLHKGKKYGRGYRMQESWLQQGRSATCDWLINDKIWHKQIYPFTWLIERFSPMPTWHDPKTGKLIFNIEEFRNNSR